MVLLYRPSTNKIIWYQQFPWVFQHDIDIISDKEIMIFNNNLEWSKTKVKDFNEINIYDFEKDKTYNILQMILKVLIEDLVVGLKKFWSTPKIKLLNKLT